MNTPKLYLVGGAVRDHLLGLPVTERDWVMVGSTPEAMLAAGYLCVGADFPVFLHPETRDEVALARTERKHSVGYKGFAVHADPNVTLVEDLQRRDLTINAIAQDSDGNLIDPYLGKQDLNHKILRHVSSAFAEDPVRILRLARFYARFGDMGFTVAPETIALCQNMVNQGEVDALVPERVWQETRRALNTARPDLFFELLKQCGALQKLFPEIHALFGVPQTAKYHPEIDTGVHLMMCLHMAAKLNLSEVARYAVLCHDLGKGITPLDILPRHTGHEAAGLPLVRAMSERLRVPTEHRDTALKVTEWHLWAHRVPELTPEDFLMLFEKLDAFRRPQRLIDFSHACEADSRGRLGFEDRDYPNGQILRDKFAAVQHISTQDFLAQGIQGAALGMAVRAERLRILANG